MPDEPKPFNGFNDVEAQQNSNDSFPAHRTTSNDSLSTPAARIPTQLDENVFGRTLTKTETAASLAELGLSRSRPAIDPNFPSIRDDVAPEFPEEYTIETETGLVPVTSLRQIRSNSSQGLTRRRTRMTPYLEPHGEEDDEFKKASDSGEDSIAPHQTQQKQEQASDEVQFVTFLIDDPENPQNWSRPFKWTITLVASFLVLAVAYGSAAPTGGMGLICDKFHVSEEVANLTVAIMVIGFAVGPLIWSPLSEQIGRRPVYIISMSLYVIFNIPCALAPNIGCLLACRFLCGVFSSSGLSLAGGSIADVWKTEERGFAIAYFAAAPYCGPVFGPLISGWINIGTGRYDLLFWINMAFGGLGGLAICALPETYAPIILKRRAQRLRKETGDQSIMTEQEALKLSPKELIMTVLIRPMAMICTEPVLDLMNLYIVMIYSLLYGFFFAYPVIFSKLYGYNDGITGLMFIPILMGALCALVTTPILEKKYVALCHRRDPTPEDRLIGAMIGAPFIPIALYLLAATSYKHVIWVGPCSAGLPFGYGMVMCYYSVNNYIIDSYTAYAASALAAKVFMRSGGGAAFCLFTAIMYRSRLGLNGASYLLAGLATLMLVIPFLFYKYGAGIREKLTKAK